MEDSWIINKLKKDRIFNPFNESFDFKEAFKTFTESIKRDKNINIDPEDAITLLTTFWFNKYFIDIYSFLKDQISKISIEKKLLIQIISSAANRDVYILNGFRLKREFGDEPINIEDYQKFKIMPIDKNFGNIDVQSLVDVTVDLQNVFLNFIRYFGETEAKDKLNENEVIIGVLNIFRACNMYHNIKNAYDTAIWENGYITYDQINKRIDIKFKDPTRVLCIRAGDIRLKRNVSAAIVDFEEEWKNNKNIRALVERSYSQYKKSVKLHKVKFNSGYIRYSLRNGVETETLYLTEIMQIHLDVYYPFISTDYLPRLDNLNINNLIVIFSEIHYLFKHIREIDGIETKVNTLSDYTRFTAQIRECDLVNYLTSKTTFSKIQIKQFINLLTYSGGRYDLWKTPFIKTDDYYIISLLNIVDANILYLVDVWLNLGGYSLEDRGVLFENYIKQDLTSELRTKKFQYKIPKINKFRNSKKQTEEIDIIINTKHTVIFGEIKCITYPLEPRDYSNALKRIQRGVKQIIRKTNFVLDSEEDFKSIIGEYRGKEIVKLVITNYPFFTSIVFDNVVIVDYYLLKAYVKAGQLVKMKIDFRDDTIKSSEFKKTEVFYTNEDQFSKNIRKYMENPPAVKELIDMLTIKPTKISMKEDIPQIYIDSADTIEEIILNEGK